MPNYEFKSDVTGDVIEKYFPMTDPPDIGEVIQVDGQDYKRILSSGPQIKPVWFPYVSNRLPRNIKGVKNLKFDKQGKPIVETQAQEREIAASLGWERD